MTARSDILKKVFPTCTAEALHETAEEHNASNDEARLRVVLEDASKAAAMGCHHVAVDGPLSDEVQEELERRGFLISRIESCRNEDIWSVSWTGGV